MHFPREPGSIQAAKFRRQILRVISKHQDREKIMNEAHKFGHIAPSKIPLFMRELSDFLLRDREITEILVQSIEPGKKADLLKEYALKKHGGDRESAKRFLLDEANFVNNFRYSRSSYFDPEFLERYMRLEHVPEGQKKRFSVEFLHQVNNAIQLFQVPLISAGYRIR